MSYADKLQEIAARQREDLRNFERMRARARAQFTMCSKARKAMLTDFFNTIRNAPCSTRQTTTQ